MKETAHVNDPPIHRIIVKSSLAALVVRDLIERKLGVRVWTEHNTVWAVHFQAPRDVDLDFLRPEILPPRETP